MRCARQVEVGTASLELIVALCFEARYFDQVANRSKGGGRHHSRAVDGTMALTVA